jgi:hypothetical protein
LVHARRGDLLPDLALEEHRDLLQMVSDRIIGRASS